MHDFAPASSEPRVGSEMADSYEVIGGHAGLGLIILCDHASNALPHGYGTLGLDSVQLKRHIAFDIGVDGVVRRLAAALGVPAVLTHYSRLLIDCNRGADDPTMIMRISDGAVIPGNRVLDAAEREKRITQYYEPYHRAIDRTIDRCIPSMTPFLLSIHSFTNVWKGQARPWHAAVLWDRDDRLARRLLDELRADPALIVGDNEPYTGRLRGDTMWQHGTMRGLAHAIIEIRQDLIADEAGEARWAERLEPMLRRMMSCPATLPELTTIRHYGSHTD